VGEFWKADLSKFGGITPKRLEKGSDSTSVKRLSPGKTSINVRRLFYIPSSEITFPIKKRTHKPHKR
jgi:hypothetical protein